jgi:hypothetical protein
LWSRRLGEGRKGGRVRGYVIAESVWTYHHPSGPDQCDISHVLVVVVVEDVVV